MKLNKQLRMAAERNAQLIKENNELRAKKFPTETPTVHKRSTEDFPGPFEISENTKEKLIKQWHATVEERRMKYEKHCIAVKLNNTKELNSVPTKKSQQKNFTQGHVGKRKKTSDEPQWKKREERSQEKHQTILSKKSPTGTDAVKDFSLSNETGELCEKTQKRTHHWKPGTVLIARDSMIHDLFESKFGKNECLKVRSFPGAVVDDMKDYIKLLLLKKPWKIVFHVATNNTVDNSAEEIVRKLLDLKEKIEKALNGCEVILYLPIRRIDNIKANKTLQALNTKMFSLSLNIVDNSTILISDLGCRGLHLNEKGVKKLASNIIGKLRCLNILIDEKGSNDAEVASSIISNHNFVKSSAGRTDAPHRHLGFK